MSSDLYIAEDEVFDDSVALTDVTEGDPAETLVEDDGTLAENYDPEWPYEGEEEVAADYEEDDSIAYEEEFPEDMALSQPEDSYLSGWGDGWAYFEDAPDPTLGDVNTLEFAEGIEPDDILIETDGLNLTIRIAGTDAEIIVANFLSQEDLYGSDNPLQKIAFNNGITWDIDDILAKLWPETLPVSGEPGDETEWMPPCEGIPDWCGTDMVWQLIDFSEWQTMEIDGWLTTHDDNSEAVYLAVLGRPSMEDPYFEVC